MGLRQGQQQPSYPMVGIPPPTGGGQPRDLLIPLAPHLVSLVVGDKSAH